MLGKTAFAFICISLSNFVLGNDSNTSALCELVHSGAVPYDTLSPTNVDTKNVTSVRGDAFIILNRNEYYIDIENTGNNFEISFSRLFGNVSQRGRILLCDQVYLFHKMIFYANPNLGRSFNTIDGRGYGSFNESLKHRNGLLAIDFMTDLSSINYPSFRSFYTILITQRKPPYIARTISARLVKNWFNQELYYSKIHEYYAFFGSHIDPETGEHFQSVINILAKKSALIIGKEQFLKTFALLERRAPDFKYRIQDSTQPLNPFNDRPIYEGPEIADPLYFFS